VVCRSFPRRRTVELGQGEIVAAGEAHEQAFKYAIKRIHGEAAMAGGHGVVGVHVERRVYSTHIEISLLGTAVRPVGAKAVDASSVFVSDLSARDFAMLMVAGWQPLGLATGQVSSTPPVARGYGAATAVPKRRVEELHRGDVLGS